MPPLESGGAGEGWPAGSSASHSRDAGRITVIEPSTGWRALDLRELWAYRELIYVLAERDVKVRYKQTALGVAWALLQPVGSMLVFSVFFGMLARIPSDGLPYPLFVLTALLPWTFFANAVSISGNSLVSSAHLLSKVYFPRLVIPIASTGAGLVDFAIGAGLLLTLLLVYGVGWSLTLLLVPGIVVLILLTALGIGTLLAALSARYRDFRYVIPFMIQLWMFVTPVVYPASLVPEAWRWLLYLNPMAGLIDAFRAACLGTPIGWGGLVLSLLIAASMFVIGLLVFERLERRLADVI